MTDAPLLVDAYGKPAAPFGTAQVFPAQPRIDLGIETRRTGADSCPIKWAETQAHNNVLAQAALFDLSQYKDDRDLLEWARENKIKVIFDLQETSSHQADGTCDFQKNAVVVKPGISVMRMQYAIIHELQHMFDRANGLVADATMSMKSGTKVSRALEANANTREALHAWGCVYGIADGFYKPAGVVEAYEAGSNISEIAAAARTASHHLKTGNKAQFCRDVFASFYRQESQIIFYDEGKLNFLNGYISNLPRLRVTQPYESVLEWVVDKVTLAEWRFNRISRKRSDKNLSTFMSDDSWTHQKIAKTIPFLTDASFSLDDPRYYGFSYQFRNEYFEFVKRIDALKAKSGYRHLCDIPICLFMPEKEILVAIAKPAASQRMLDIVAVPIPQQSPQPAKTNIPSWVALDIGYLQQAPAMQPAAVS